MANITFFEAKPWEKQYLKKKLSKHSLKFFKEPLTAENVVRCKNSEIVSVFIRSNVNKQVLKKFLRLKNIVTRSTGFDHIDIQECNNRGILVQNVPNYGETTVAEHTFALLLSLSRNVHKSYVRTLKDDYSIKGLKGFDLKGKTIGIVGGGRIGLHVARMAKGFGMKVLVYDIKKQEFLSEVLGFTYVDLKDLLKHSDIVSLHLPYTKETHHLMNRETIRKMKKGAILINTSRGGVIDTNALLDALEKKHLAGAGLDVIEGEELIKEEKELLHEDSNLEKWKTVVRDRKILRMENVVFTPHIAFYSKEALKRILDTTLENINSYLNKHPINTIN
jgi:D-lactate dehydrogenase